MSATLMTRLAALDAAALADVMTTMGLEHQVLSPAFKPLAAGAKLCGPALCAQGGVGAAANIATFDLDDAVFDGAVVLIDTGRCELGAIMGENMFLSMGARGARGFVVDGGVRDAAALSALKAAVFCRYTSPINAHRRWRYTAIGAPITLPGVAGDVLVNPQDLVFGDEDGICIIPAAYAAEIVEWAEIHAKTEAGIAEAIKAGTPRRQATEASGRLKHVRVLHKDAPAPRD